MTNRHLTDRMLPSNSLTHADIRSETLSDGSVVYDVLLTTNVSGPTRILRLACESLAHAQRLEQELSLVINIDAYRGG